MQEIRSSNPSVVTGVCDPNKSRARHHHNLKCFQICQQISFFIVLNIGIFHTPLFFLTSANASFFVSCGLNNSVVSFSSNTFWIASIKRASLLIFSSLQISTREGTRLRFSEPYFCFNFRWVSFWRFYLINTSFVLFFWKIV